MKHFELGIKREKAITNPEKGCWPDYCYDYDPGCDCEGNTDICSCDVETCSIDMPC